MTAMKKLKKLTRPVAGEPTVKPAADLRVSKKPNAKLAGLSQAVRAAVESFTGDFMISDIAEFIEQNYPKMPPVGDHYGKHEIAHRLRQLIKKNLIETVGVKRFEAGRGAVVYRKNKN